MRQTRQAGHGFLPRTRLLATLLSVVAALGLAAGASAALAPTYPAGARTGVARVDWALRAMQRHDTDALYAAIKYHKVACSTDAGAGIPCKAGEANGTLVEIWVDGTCEPSVSRREDIDVRAVVERFVDADQGLYAVYQSRMAGLASKGGFGILYAQRVGTRSSTNSAVLWPDGSVDTFYFGHCGNRPTVVWGLSKGKVLLAPRHR